MQNSYQEISLKTSTSIWRSFCCLGFILLNTNKVIINRYIIPADVLCNVYIAHIYVY